MLRGCLLACALSIPALATASDWTRFRGPNGTGVADEGPLPVSFGPETNVVWETPLPRGKSSPVLTDTKVFLTAHEDGQLLTIALDRATGRELWRRAAPSRRVERMHRLNDEAAPTPVTDGKNVFAFFGGYGLVSYDGGGVERWTLPLGPFTNYHGMGSSPILVDGKLILICDQDLEAYALAIDPSNGEILWKRPRPDFVHSFSTPVTHQAGAGDPVIVVPGSYRMTGYSTDGREVWRLDGLTYQVKSGPVVDGDRLYFSGWAVGGEPGARLELPAWDEVRDRFDSDGDGELAQSELRQDWHPNSWAMHDRNKNGTMDARDWAHYRARRVSENSCMAIRLGGTGDVTGSHLLWRYRKSLPEVASPVLYRGVLYLVRNGGIVTTLDPASGSVLKQGRLRDAIDGFYASPVAGDGKVYMTSDAGRVAVLEAAGAWTVLRTNDLGEDVYATPAIADGKLFIRTASRLYCFGEPRQ
ncbi:MAG: PQQ-binding-like beta-propeller repeat protein [Bryobacterales bacterium]|nr:PQQ-binding-like beta-propeller repeat protein [Bryobacterales bacterium]